METFAISEFKARCLAILDRVHKTGSPVLITKHGVPIARINPPVPELGATSGFSCMSGTAEELEDILAPLDPGDWNALQ
ncbi:MAG: hypothetical protein A2289_16900 [Deltaproteobacteria bacterium RIFOXYA12_FULL_58_15]|nr:MAG: hypothetical protein A2289_16900 [Deltaproteobacteria bacterium RIFOXYA12_FULL_58_15]OGR10307.1 MAG: hypothetical protein A2341_16930 [Deltaproteobacteria bacterium RIFOXYB12_FULL_58_9]